VDNSIPKLPACIRLLTTSTPPLPIYTYTPANYIGTFLGYRRTLPHRTRTRPDHMRTLPGWHRIYGDADGVVFVRDGAG